MKTIIKFGIVLAMISLLLPACGIPQEDYDAVVDERDDAKVQVETLHSQLNDAQTDLTALQGSLTTTQSQLVTEESALAETQSDLASARAQISSLQSQVSSLQNDLAEEKANVSGLEEVITAQEGSQVGDLSLDFQLNELDGETVSLGELRGNPVMINFWATWCPPCRNEMPYLQQVYDDWKDKGLILITIDLRESSSQVREFLQSNNLSLPTLLDTDGKVAGEYSITGIPTTLFINKYGVIRARKVGGFSSAQDIEGYLRKIMP